MSAIASALRRRWVEVAWAIFALANLTVLIDITGWETIPFHFVWVSLTIVYGIRLWRLRSTLIVLGAVMLVTGWALYDAAASAGGPGLDEMTEVPLMGAMFLAMVWHAERARRAVASEQRLRERQAEFARDASHELKTPITVARGHAELILEAAPSDQIASDAEVVLDELNRLTRASERLLILAAAEHPNFLRHGECRVEPFLSRTVRRWSVTAQRGWELDVQAHGWIPADLERVELAMDSLIENAVRYTDVHDDIHVSAYVRDAALIIEVADGGVGISPEQLPHVFDRFARTPRPLEHRAGGTGLGLAMVKAIVESHGGTVSVRSRLGEGTTFVLRLPGFRPATAPLPAPEPVHDEPADTRVEPRVTTSP
ncbi:MAG: sensor histidine kinase [Actinomycetota bacterium]